jgi:hypothetical protein
LINGLFFGDPQLFGISLALFSMPHWEFCNIVWAARVELSDFCPLQSSLSSVLPHASLQVPTSITTLFSNTHPLSLTKSSSSNTQATPSCKILKYRWSRYHCKIVCQRTLFLMVLMPRSPLSTRDVTSWCQGYLSQAETSTVEMRDTRCQRSPYPNRLLQTRAKVFTSLVLL